MVKKVCFVTFRFKTGGVERLFLTLTQNMPEREIYLLPLNSDFDHIIDHIPSNVTLITTHNRNWIVNFLNRVRIPLFSSVVALLVKILIIRNNKALRDAIFINFSDTCSTLLLTYFSASRHTPLSWIHINPDNLLRSRFFFLYRLLYKKMGQIVCICKDQKEQLQSILPGFSIPKFTVIYNFIDTGTIDRLKIEKTDTDYPYILTVARIDMRTKDFRTLVDAYALLKKELNVVEKLVIVGEGPDMEMLRKYSEESGYGDDIVLAGYDINPYKWMNHAEMFVLSSRSEGFGLVLAEAMQCGTPVIATDCNVGPREILNYGECGILVEVGNVLELKEAMRTFLSDKDKKSACIEKATLQVQNFNVFHTVKRIEILLNEWK